LAGKSEPFIPGQESDCGEFHQIGTGKRASVHKTGSSPIDRQTGGDNASNIEPCTTVLGQIYATRRAGPQDLVHAYMWFLIASEQITQAKNHVNQSTTMEQLLEAEQRAAEWTRKIKNIPPSSIENPANASTV
jgi:hypothetical protein